jgi:hypothetical protein
MMSNSTQINITITQEMKVALDRQSRSQNLTQSEIVRRAIGEYLESQGETLTETLEWGGFRWRKEPIELATISLAEDRIADFLTRGKLAYLTPVLSTSIYCIDDKEFFDPTNLREHGLEVQTIVEGHQIVRSGRKVEIQTYAGGTVAQARITSIRLIIGYKLTEQELELLGYQTADFGNVLSWMTTLELIED